MTTPTIRFSTERFGFLAPFVSKEETRYYLNGVHIEPCQGGGIYMAATDGHVLGITYDPDGEIDKPRIFSARCPGFKQLTKKSKNNTDCEAVAVNGLDWMFKRDDGKVDAVLTEIDGTFPDYRLVIPKKAYAKRKPASQTFNARLYAAFAAPVDSTTTPLRLYSDGSEGGPVLAVREDLPWFLGVIMPMRGGDFAFNKPILDFLDDEAEEAA